ncbi:endonuclease-reverse transcriptase [Elysia marginata]|uniref:Endonuclease-reverse transcriptase n=1 Tax=Elysia marginata TaxID=1093978 RepID=A0AAV4FBS4_9GAST|nr:endonuclease-reverse transcriptase [Elysia marginata]
MWIYTRLAKISWKDKKANQEVCEHLGTRRELVNTIKTRKIKYFGHIKRHASYLKDVLEGKIEGSRPRGDREDGGPTTLRNGQEKIYTNALWRPRTEQSGNPFLVNPWNRDGTESE